MYSAKERGKVVEGGRGGPRGDERDRAGCGWGCGWKRIGGFV